MVLAPLLFFIFVTMIILYEYLFRPFSKQAWIYASHSLFSPLCILFVTELQILYTRQGKETRSGQEGKGIVYFGAFNQSGSRGVAFVHLPNVEERKEGRYSAQKRKRKADLGITSPNES